MITIIQTYRRFLYWKHFASCILVLICFKVIGQSPTIFYDVSQGISQNTITSITQDDNGFLWIGTRYGLNKYDGSTYQHYLHDSHNPNSIKANAVEKVITGNNGILWIGTNHGGLNKLNTTTGKISHFTTDNSAINSNHIRYIYLDENGYLFIAGEKKGLDILDTNTETFLTADNHSLAKKMQDKVINALEGNSKGSLVISTVFSGVYYYNSFTETLQSLPTIKSVVRTVFAFRDNEFHIGTNNGYYAAKVMQNSLTVERVDIPQINESVVLSLLKGEDEITWVGTENDGLYKINPDKSIEIFKSSSSENSINGNSIWCLYQDRFGIIWIGSYLNGLCKIDHLQEKFSKLYSVNTGDKEIPLKLVNGFAVDNDSICWIGLDGGGLIQWNLYTNQFTEINSIWESESNKVVKTLNFIDNKLWIGTWGEGLIIYDVNSKQSEKLTVSQGGVIGDRIYNVIEDKNGNIWSTCHEDGLTIHPNGDVTSPIFILSNSIKGNPSMRLRSIEKDCDGNILIGSDRSGLLKLNIDNTTITEVNSLMSESDELHNDITINTLLVDRNCNLWIGTEGSGVYNISYDQTKSVNFDTEDGLASNMIYDLLEDENGDIWGSTNNGIFSYNIESNSFNNYTSDDGLTADEFVYSSGYKMEDGTLIFGSINGLNYFKPSQIPFNSRPPEAYITDIRIANEALANISNHRKPESYNGANIKLDHTQNDLAIEYTSLNFTQGNLNKFQYILEGFDKDWSEVTTNRTATFDNLPYGKYTFKLKASNNDGVWSQAVPYIGIHIKKPWYRTLLAWVCYFLITLGIFITVQRTLFNQIQLKNDLAIESLKLSQLKEVDKVKSQFFSNISHEFLTPLTLILTPLKRIQSKGDNTISDQTIDSMTSNANRLQKFIKQILALAKLESGEVKLRVEKHLMNPWLSRIANNFNSIAIDKSMMYILDIPSRPIIAYYDEDRLEQVIVNLLSNAFKYTEDGGTVSVSLTEKTDSIIIKIIDTGQGIAKPDLDNIFNRFYRQKNENLIGGTGIGLSITKQILAQHHAEINVESEIGVGSAFIITIQKGTDHFNSNSGVEITYPDQSKLTQVSEINANNLLSISQSQTNGASKPIILVVEDNPDIRNLIAEILSADYSVFLAEDGIQGIKLASEIMPDLIITDLMMPGKNGYELCEAIKNDKLTSHIYIIMLTVRASEDSIKEGLIKGADYYLTKPFNAELLKLHIANILKRRQDMAIYFRGEYEYSTSNILIQEEAIDLESYDGDSEIQLSEIDQEFLKSLNEIIDKNLGNSDFSVVDLTHHLGFSKSQLYRKLKAIIGMSANAYIRTKRLQKATELISTNNFTIAEVTYKVGFNDLQYFRSCFKNTYGVNPSEYAGEEPLSNIEQ